MKLPRRQIPASGRRRCRAAGCIADRQGRDLSDAGRSYRRRCRGRRPERHRRAPARSMVVGAARPTIRRREPHRRRRQYCDRGGGTIAARRLHLLLVDFGQRGQRYALRQVQFQFRHRHRTGRGHHARAQRHGGQSVGSSQDCSRVHRLCQGESRQDQYGRRPATGPRPTCPGNCSNRWPASIWFRWLIVVERRRSSI